MAIKVEKCDLCKDEITGSSYCIDGGVYCSQVCSCYAIYPTKEEFIASKQ